MGFLTWWVPDTLEDYKLAIAMALVVVANVAVIFLIVLAVHAIPDRVGRRMDAGMQRLPWKSIYIASYWIALVAVCGWAQWWVLLVTMPYFMLSNPVLQREWGIEIDWSPPAK